MRATYNGTEDIATEYDYDYSTTEKTIAKKDTTIENINTKSRLIKTVKGNPKNTRYGHKMLAQWPLKLKEY